MQHYMMRLRSSPTHATDMIVLGVIFTPISQKAGLISGWLYLSYCPRFVDILIKLTLNAHIKTNC